MKRASVVLPFLLIFTGCGGGHHSDPSDITIGELTGVLFSTACALPNGTIGQIEGLAFNFADAAGDVAGGLVEITATGQPFGPTVTLTLGVPSETVALDGGTTGRVRVLVCLRFGSNTSVTETVLLQDSRGHRSNSLSRTFGRPAGALEVPKGMPFEIGPGPGG